MDIQGIDWFSVGSGLAILGSIAKGFMASRQADKAEAHAKAIESDREATKIDRDKEFQAMRTKIAVMEAKCGEMTKRLDEGNTHFKELEKEMKDNNGLLRELLGALRNAGLNISVTTKGD